MFPALHSDEEMFNKVNSFQTLHNKTSTSHRDLKTDLLSVCRHGLETSIVILKLCLKDYISMHISDHII